MNRISASRLHLVATTLKVPITDLFDGASATSSTSRATKSVAFDPQALRIAEASVNISDKELRFVADRSGGSDGAETNWAEVEQTRDAIDRVSSQIYLGCMPGSPPAEPGGIMISVLPSSGVLAFIPGSTSEGQSTPFDWPSSSPSVWLLRSCWEHALASVVWADADDIIARVIATKAASFAVLFFVMWGQPPPERAVP